MYARSYLLKTPAWRSVDLVLHMDNATRGKAKACAHAQIKRPQALLEEQPPELTVHQQILNMPCHFQNVVAIVHRSFRRTEDMHAGAPQPTVTPQSMELLILFHTVVFVFLRACFSFALACL